MKRMIRVLLAAAVLVTSLTCTAFAATEGYTTDISGTVNYDETTGTYSASCTGLTADKQYVLLVAEGTPDNYTITQDSILYIDQAGSDGSISFPAFIPKNIADSVVLLGGNFGDSVTSPVILGTIKSQYTLGDVNNDGRVNGLDTTMLMRALGRLTTLTATQEKAADVTQDGRVNGLDTTKLMRVLGRLESFD